MIFLSFDIEEFDVPCDYGFKYSPEKEGIEVSCHGTEQILNLLEREKVKATFFCTAVFASSKPYLIQKIVKAGHEIASHGYSHSKKDNKGLNESKEILEKIAGVQIKGFRQPRMGEIENSKLREAGYLYHASINPTFIPGHYCNLFVNRTPHYNDGVLAIPVSVSPFFRIPMFWLSFHHLPLKLYKWLTLRILHKDGLFNTYFHPWEFYPLNQHDEYNLPYMIKRRTGDVLIKRLEVFIRFAKERGESFGIYSQYLDLIKI